VINGNDVKETTTINTYHDWSCRYMHIHIPMYILLREDRDIREKHSDPVCQFLPYLFRWHEERHRSSSRCRAGY